MTITIIGTGNMARAIGIRLLTARHEVVFHSRNIAESQEAISSVPELAAAQLEPFGGNVAEIVVLAVPYGKPIHDIAATYEDKLANKIVIDITNPMDFDALQLLPLQNSGAEANAALLPKSRVVKAFNTTFATRLAAGSKAGDLPLDIYMASDDQTAKQIVGDIIRSINMRPLDCGKLAEARHLEGFEAIHLRLQTQLGDTWNTAIKIVG